MIMVVPIIVITITLVVIIVITIIEKSCTVHKVGLQQCPDNEREHVGHVHDLASG